MNGCGPLLEDVISNDLIWFLFLLLGSYGLIGRCTMIGFFFILFLFDLFFLFKTYLICIFKYNSEC